MEPRRHPRSPRATSSPARACCRWWTPTRVLDVPVLVDARAPSGTAARPSRSTRWPAASRAPSTSPTSTNLGADGRFRAPTSSRALYEAAGVPIDGAEVAVYCGSGVTAVHDVIALELLGVHAALYPGCWSGWITDPARPVETG